MNIKYVGKEFYQLAQEEKSENKKKKTTLGLNS